MICIYSISQLQVAVYLQLFFAQKSQRSLLGDFIELTQNIEFMVFIIPKIEFYNDYLRH